MKVQTSVSRLAESFKNDIEALGQDEAIKRFFNHHLGRALSREMEQIESSYILGKDRAYGNKTAGDYFNGRYRNDVYPRQQQQ